MHTPQQHMKKHTLLGLVVLIMFALPANAQVFISSNTMTNGNFDPEGLIVGYSDYSDYIAKTNGTSPTLQFNTGGFSENIESYNNSTANVSGATIGTGGVQVYNTSTLNLTSGNIENNSYVYDSASLNISGGTIGTVLARDNSRVNMTGGTIYEISGIDNSIINVSGGIVTGDVFAEGNNDTVNMNGGTTPDLAAIDGGTANLTGGTVTGLIDVGPGGTANLFSGYPGSSLLVDNGGTMRVFGSNLSADLINPDFNIYTITGMLSDGTVIPGEQLEIEPGGHFYFESIEPITPEPGTYALLGSLGLAGAAFLRRKRIR